MQGTTQGAVQTTPHDKVNVLLIGGGGREHAIAWKLRASPRLGTLYTTHPENPGLAALCTPVNVPVSIREIYRLQQFIEKNAIGLVVIGPEDPLVEGFADKLETPSCKVFGPRMEAARIEGDKAWAKQLMRGASIPTGEARVFTDVASARQYLESRVGDDERLSGLMQRLEGVRDPVLRRSVLDAILRVGRAALDRTQLATADLTLIKDSGAFKYPGGDTSALVSFATPAATAYRAVRQDLPVIKASGLAKGKGVVVPSTMDEAMDAIEAIMVKRVFGDAGSRVVIEERLDGPEVSVLAITDGRTLLVLPPAQDHKRLRDGDQGPNTGGMGAFCPSETIDDATMEVIEREVLVPTLDALRREGIPYVGVLYAGIMLTHAGPKVLEFNARFGDPECQAILMRLKSDLLELLLATCEGRLDDARVEWDPRPSCCVVMASDGYPEKPKSGAIISGLSDAAARKDSMVFHAGTKRSSEGHIVTSGGRVLSVVGIGSTHAQARTNAYATVGCIGFDGMQVRRDIGGRG
jgi:phosphoribosylamine--glycine ligase